MSKRAEEILDQVNYNTWNRSKTVKSYSRKESLQKPEEVIFEKLSKDILGKKLLDIGVGTGRTVPYVTQFSDDYLGIDYSPAMVQECKTKYPERSFVCLDARDMSVFKNETFDFILFSYNGIDCVSHPDRILILQEIFRVLKTNGYFVFSSHNRDVNNPEGIHNIQRPWLFNPVKWLGRFLRYGEGVYRHLKNKRYEIDEEEYAIINDSGVNYALLIYYISSKAQIKQLRTIGFNKTIQVFNSNGEEIDQDDQSPWLYYLVVK
jgi:ubiquinone/menaquinone biosynthesis C-methylase UbiE